MVIEDVNLKDLDNVKVPAPISKDLLSNIGEIKNT